MKNKKNLYEILGVSSAATMQDIKQAHRELTIQIEEKKPIIGIEEAKVQKEAIDMAFDVLSVQYSRDAYDAKLLSETPLVEWEGKIDVVFAVDDNRKNPLVKMLRLIALILAIWIGLKLVFSFMAYRSYRSVIEDAKTPELVYEKQEQLRLQEFNQEYGIQAKSIEEADAILAKQRQESREHRENERLQKQQDKEYERWLREGNRISEEQALQQERADRKLVREIERSYSHTDVKRNDGDKQRRYEANKQRRKLGLPPL